MPIFAYDNPRLVFIHIPKNAGTSVRAAIPAQAAVQAYGFIPHNWLNAYSFTVVRDPLERFFSAVHMFKHGAAEVDDYYSKPRWPDLTVDDALEVLEDDKFPFDRTDRHLAANLKHHLLPQTHPFNCLHFAKNILRYEHLSRDFPNLAARFGLQTQLARLRISESETLRQLRAAATPVQLERIAFLYAEDFQVLGYSEGGLAKGAVRPVKARPPQIWETWPTYFSNEEPADPRRSLPAEDCNLMLFRDARIPGDPGPTWTGRAKKLNFHFHKLQEEFGGSSRLAHLLACCIVVNRRFPDDAAAKRLFLRIIKEHGAEVASELNLRWLTSVCDTVIDCSEDPVDRTLGLTGSLLANVIKLYETELQLFYPRVPAPPQVRVRPGGRLLDGVVAFWPERGDMIANLLRRAESVLSTPSLVGPIVQEILARCISCNTAFKRFERLKGAPNLPLLPFEHREVVERILNGEQDRGQVTGSGS